jgi:hypothetical protein
MLVLKKNIYYCPFPTPALGKAPAQFLDEDGPRPLAYPLIFLSLEGDQKLFEELSQVGDEAVMERLQIVFPHSANFCDFKTLREISKKLWEGLQDSKSWWTLNAYHWCYLYDTLTDFIEDYSYGNDSHRRKLCPEMLGQPFNFNQFLNEYFFNTAFLSDPERYQKMSPREKRLLGKIDHALMGAVPTKEPLPSEIDPCLEKTIRRIPPERKDVELIPCPAHPYPN